MKNTKWSIISEDFLIASKFFIVINWLLMSPLSLVLLSWMAQNDSSIDSSQSLHEVGEGKVGVKGVYAKIPGICELKWEKKWHLYIYLSLSLHFLWLWI